MRNKYHFDLLFRHSNETALNTRRTLKKELAEARKVFGFLDHHFSELKKQPKTLVRNVKMVLTARFINHLFSTLILIERGLILDAFNCSRTSIEVTAFYWLVCHDEGAAALYEEDKGLAPIEVRKRLEKLGVDISIIRDLYGLESSIAHVGNPYDNLQIRWERESDGKLLIGGGLNIPVQKAMLQGIVLSVFRFIKFEPDYVVPDVDAIVEVVSVDSGE